MSVFARRFLLLSPLPVSPNLPSIEERYQALTRSIDQGFCIIEMLWDEKGSPTDYRFLEGNALFETQTGLQDAIGRTARELVPGLEPEWFAAYAAVARTGQAVHFTQGSEEMGRWFDVHAFPLGDAAISRVGILFRDVTRRRQIDEEVARLSAESRARLSELETLLEVIPVGIGIALDPECREIRVNPAFARVLGLSPAANASKTAPLEERPSGFRVIDDRGCEIPGEELPMQVAAREGREVSDHEVNVVHENGRKVRLLEYAAPLYDERGIPRGSVGVFVDITERRREEEQQRFLVQLDDAVRALSNPEEIVATAARLLGEHLQVNRCAYADVEDDQDTFNLTGDYNRDVPSIVGRYAFSDFGEEAVRLMRADEAYIVEDIETHQPPPRDLAAYRATLIRAVICVPLHKGGRVVAAMAVHQKTPRGWTENDVRLALAVANRCWEALQRAKVTRILETSEERFRTLADNIAQLAWMADATGDIFWYNQRWFDYTGSTLAEMRGWGWEKVHHAEHVTRVVEKWSRHLAAGREWEDTFPLRGANGEYRWFLSRAFPIRDEHGKVLRWFGTNTDITEQRAGAEALADAKEQAEAASRAKDDFLAVLSHELRTPLTPVLLSAAALEEDERLPEEARSELTMIRRNIELEARLIEDLLDLTRIARGKLTLRLEECDAHSLIEFAVQIVRESVARKELNLVMQLGASRSSLSCDTARLQQVIWNMLSNAVKYTPAGGSITVRTTDRDERIVIEVSDTGLGIDPAAQELIFLPFEQAGLANNHAFGGLGLGLSITKAIVEMHVGQISVHSAGGGKGTTFRVELPTIATRRDSDQSTPLFPHRSGVRQADATPLRLLIVEDHEATLSVLTRLLVRAGHSVMSASSVTTALEAARGATFDLVLSDIGLPDGSGLTLMQELRDRYGLRGIALTGYGQEEDQRRSHEAGFVAHLTKPIEIDQLRQALAEFATHRSGHADDSQLS
ncbi:MAG TPA: PAS domain-containing protein [Chthoniobacteraceae bacterium]|jgi:PAS domain S-box-containing protein